LQVLRAYAEIGTVRDQVLFRMGQFFMSRKKLFNKKGELAFGILIALFFYMKKKKDMIVLQGVQYGKGQS
jgi:hypothetical protein